jgi:hypothetical protein
MTRHSWARRGRRVEWSLVLAAVLAAAGAARGEIQFTEIMHSPGGSDPLWEWVEIRNTSAAAVNLDGWVFDDDDDGNVGAANILATNGNTVVAAHGAAVLYPGDELNFDPTRFTNAWGAGITLIPVDGFTSLTEMDALGLWPSHATYLADAIPMATMSPRRTFAGAAASINYTMDFPAAASGHSIAWTGTGSVASGSNWAESEVGMPNVVVSSQTNFASTAINSTDDLGNPGLLPAGPAAPGLRITEIMFAPASPAVVVGFSEQDFEWVEVLNNSGSPINFGVSPYVFDDFVGELNGPNITSGTLAVGEVGILFNDETITPDDMETMWGAGLKFIPVSDWPALNNNGGDTIAIWDSIGDYNNEAIDGDDHRAHALAAAAVVYNTVAGQGWPTINGMSSIYLENLTGDPNDGDNWVRSGDNDDDLESFHASPILQMAVDHPGGDVGSPGHAPGSVITPVAGDYNQNGVVDAADYSVWRDHLGQTFQLPNEGGSASPGIVNAADYDFWKLRFGQTSGSGSVAAAVPEPASVVLASLAAMGAVVWHALARAPCAAWSAAWA